MGGREGCIFQQNRKSAEKMKYKNTQKMRMTRCNVARKQKKKQKVRGQRRCSGRCSAAAISQNGALEGGGVKCTLTLLVYLWGRQGETKQKKKIESALQGALNDPAPRDNVPRSALSLHICVCVLEIECACFFGRKRR